MRPRTPELDRRILDAASTLFASSHFHEVRMEDISAKAEVGKGTLYRYFRDKEELFLALLENAANDFQPMLDKALQLHSDPIQRLKAIPKAAFRFFEDYPHLFQVIQQTEARIGLEHPWKKARAHTTNVICEILKELNQTGEFEINDPLLLALIFQGGMRSLFHFAPQPRSESMMDSLVDTILYGVRKPIKETNQS